MYLKNNIKLYLNILLYLKKNYLIKTNIIIFKNNINIYYLFTQRVLFFYKWKYNTNQFIYFNILINKILPSFQLKKKIILMQNKNIQNYFETQHIYNNVYIYKNYNFHKSNLLKIKIPNWKINNIIKQHYYFFWEDYFNSLPLSSFLEKKITIINFNIASLLCDKFFFNLLKQTLRLYPFLQLDRIAAKLVASIFSILVLKDSKALTYFIQSIMQEEHYSKHTLFFGFTGQLIKDVFLPWLQRFNCLGIEVIFKGKLAVGGNSRKRSLKYKTGILSSSSKYIKINKTFLIVRTKTGSVGFSVTIAW